MRPLSKFGIISCLIAVLIWAYLVVLTIVLTQTALPEKVQPLISSGQSGLSAGMADLGTAILILFTLYILIPAVGHLIGFLSGAVGLFRRSTRRWPAIVGVVLNLLPFIVGLVLFLIGGNKSTNP